MFYTYKKGINIGALSSHKSTTYTMLLRVIQYLIRKNSKSIAIAATASSCVYHFCSYIIPQLNANNFKVYNLNCDNTFGALGYMKSKSNIDYVLSIKQHDHVDKHIVVNLINKNGSIVEINDEPVAEKFDIPAKGQLASNAILSKKNTYRHSQILPQDPQYKVSFFAQSRICTKHIKSVFGIDDTSMTYQLHSIPESIVSKKNIMKYMKSKSEKNMLNIVLYNNQDRYAVFNEKYKEISSYYISAELIRNGMIHKNMTELNADIHAPSFFKDVCAESNIAVNTVCSKNIVDNFYAAPTAEISSSRISKHHSYSWGDLIAFMTLLNKDSKLAKKTKSQNNFATEIISFPSNVNIDQLHESHKNLTLIDNLAITNDVANGFKIENKQLEIAVSKIHNSNLINISAFNKDQGKITSADIKNYTSYIKNNIINYSNKANNS